MLTSGHIFLSTSLTESFGIAIVEAISTGLIVVSTNVGGVSEIFDNDSLILAEPNVESMINALQ